MKVRDCDFELNKQFVNPSQHEHSTLFVCLYARVRVNLVRTPARSPNPLTTPEMVRTFQ